MGEYYLLFDMYLRHYEGLQGYSHKKELIKLTLSIPQVFTFPMVNTTAEVLWPEETLPLNSTNSTELTATNTTEEAD